MGYNIGKAGKYGFGLGPIVIRKYLNDISGGVILDTSTYTENEIKTGHIILVDEETGTKYQPMPVSDEAYGEKPDGYRYAGIAITDAESTEPFIGVLTAGEVNDEAGPYEITDEIKTAFQEDVPNIIFDHDK